MPDLKTESGLPEPYPCGKSRSLSPVSIRCKEIDEAALLIRDAAAFARAAIADKQLVEARDPAIGHCFLDDKPNRAFLEAGGCPAYNGTLNAGSRAAVLCGLADVQLSDYCYWKFCMKGRKVYCPIWREKGNYAEDEKREETAPG